ncbi:MAG: hypothetical protein AB8C46_21765 [Burkholderiaceae bacterium]
MTSINSNHGVGAQATLAASDPVNLAELASAKPASAQPPDVFVFDSFSEGAGGIFDLDRDGLGDVDHGHIIAKIIESQTGIKPHQIDAGYMPSDNAANELMMPTLNSLLARPDVSNVYLNFSHNYGLTTNILTGLKTLAARGAQVFIAAGNESENHMARALGSHPNIHVVGSSTGVIGQTPDSTLSTFNSSAMTSVANGRVNVEVVNDGYDVNGDGKADFGRDDVSPIPFDPSGKPLDSVLVDSLGGDAFNIDMGDAPRDSVARIGTLVEQNLIDPILVEDIVSRTSLEAETLNEAYIHVSHLAAYQSSFGEAGGLVLYQVDDQGKVQVLPHEQSVLFDSPASSWAAPNAMVKHILDSR